MGKYDQDYFFIVKDPMQNFQKSYLENSTHKSACLLGGLPSEFDCWDREKSDFAKNTVKVGGTELFDVYEFRLDSKVMVQTPLESRRLFKIGGALDPQIFCHKSLTSSFSSNGESGAQLTNLKDQ